LKDIYFKNLNIYTEQAIHMQFTALHALEHDDAFQGKGHKKRRKTIRNQMDKIEEEQRVRRGTEGLEEPMPRGEEGGAVSLSSEMVADDSHSVLDASAELSRRIIGGIWGPR
jgi:hypothetical protein